MLMSIKLLSPGTDDVTWLSLDLLTLILEGSDGGFWKVSCLVRPGFLSRFGGRGPSSSSLWTRSVGSVVTRRTPFNNSLLSFLMLGFLAAMSAVVAFVIDAIVAVVAFLCKQDRNSATMGMGMECANVQMLTLVFFG